MKTTLFITVLITLLASRNDSLNTESDDNSNRQIATGIILDSLGNEVYLQYIDGKPSHYFSKIFTPVCETGVCLPIKINIYWDLTGRYVRYDQPKGEVLTKSDHELFTESDYDLLDEIMGGPDPRNGITINHSQPKQGASSKGNQQSSPAPSVASVKLKFKTAADMCDALTGSTLPQMRNKYVPGALYTSYTCWELANNSSSKMKQYTLDHLMTEAYMGHLIDCEKCQTFQITVDHISQLKKQEDAHLNTLMSIIDTSRKESTVLISIRTASRHNWQKDTVQHTLTRTFGDTAQTDRVRLEILRRWRSQRPLPTTILEHISLSISESESLFHEYEYALQINQNWTEIVFTNLMDQLSTLAKDPVKYKSLYQLMASRIEEYSSKTQEAFENLE